MKYNDNWINNKFIEQMQVTGKVVNMVNIPAIQGVLDIVNSPLVQQAQQSIVWENSMVESTMMSKQLSMLSGVINNALMAFMPEKIMVEQYQKIPNLFVDAINPIAQLYSYERINAYAQYLGGFAEYSLMHCYPDDMAEEEVAENKEVDKKIVTEIFKPNEEVKENIDKKETAVITLSPINDRVLKYLSENPKALYQLEDRDFEIVMAEIYSKLGYNVELTKVTRDGGKDIIIRKPEILGDFIYYVECKKYAAKRYVGTGIVRNLVGTVLTDKVNGGILTTTSYFTADAKKYIIDNKYDYQIQMHDYDVICSLLKQVV